MSQKAQRESQKEAFLHWRATVLVSTAGALFLLLSSSIDVELSRAFSVTTSKMKVFHSSLGAATSDSPTTTLGGVYPTSLREKSHSLPFHRREALLSTAEPRQELRLRRWVAPALFGVILGLALGFFGTTQVAHAASGAAVVAKTEARPHLGQRLALLLRSSKLPDWAILICLSALPLVELRGGVPVGLWMGLPVLEVLVLCILGNMIPIPIILCSLRQPLLARLLKPLLDRAAKKTEAIGAHDRWVGIAAFVGVPLPGTGAWTGAMVSHLLGMEVQEAVTSIACGVFIAACIMATLTRAGWLGVFIGVCLGCVALASRSYRRARAKLRPTENDV
eukprot:TRINITY_DN111635_c0_g1_i1.p1 TRINITY_DN111635_c0_g1~~TRINITY_DN111635_c0_g1_i1.p1  ORF type:complete len:335 (+),score=38.32 TRINITY_DN111635_c0_g1_i1:64-1068(+)